MKKTLAIFVFVTHDYLFSAFTTLMSFNVNNANLDYDIHLVIDYSKINFDEHAIIKDKQLLSSLSKYLLNESSELILYSSKEELYKFIKDFQIIQKLPGFKNWGYQPYAIIPFLKNLENYKFILKLDSDILVKNSIENWLNKEFYLIGHKNGKKTTFNFANFLDQYLEKADNVPLTTLNGGVLLFSDRILQKVTSVELTEALVDCTKQFFAFASERQMNITEELIIGYIFRKFGLNIDVDDKIQINSFDYLNIDSCFCVHFAAQKYKLWDSKICQRLHSEWNTYYKIFVSYAGYKRDKQLAPYYLEDLSSYGFYKNQICHSIWSYCLLNNIQNLGDQIRLITNVENEEIKLKLGEISPTTIFVRLYFNILNSKNFVDISCDFVYLSTYDRSVKIINSLECLSTKFINYQFLNQKIEGGREFILRTKFSINQASENLYQIKSMADNLLRLLSSQDFKKDKTLPTVNSPTNIEPSVVTGREKLNKILVNGLNIDKSKVDSRNNLYATIDKEGVLTYLNQEELIRKYPGVTIRGTGNILIVPENNFINLKLVLTENNIVFISPSKYEIKNLSVGLWPSSCLCIAKDFSSGGVKITLKEEKSCFIGEDCMFSNGINIWATDAHTIVYSDGSINNGSDVTIGNHVWVAQNVQILKGVNVPDNCVVGACSLVTKKTFKENSLIFGMPASSVKEIKMWHRSTPGS